MNPALWFGLGVSAIILLELLGFVVGLWFLPGAEEWPSDSDRDAPFSGDVSDWRGVGP